MNPHGMDCQCPEQENERLVGEVASLRAELNTLKTYIATLENEIKEAGKLQTSLRAENSAFRGEITSLGLECDRLHAENEKFQNEELRLTVASLQEGNEEKNIEWERIWREEGQQIGKLQSLLREAREWIGERQIGTNETNRVIDLTSRIDEALGQSSSEGEEDV